MPPTPVPSSLRPSTWFAWHGHLIRRGSRVLDLACGEGRHTLAAAERGARVVAVDRDPAGLEAGREAAARRGLDIEWVRADLERAWPDWGVFDVVLVFNYLDRARMPLIREAVGPGGYLMMETFLELQRRLGWGPQHPDHLLRPGELQRLAAPLEVLHGREVVEPTGPERWRAVASVVAQKV